MLVLVSFRNGFDEGLNSPKEEVFSNISFGKVKGLHLFDADEIDIEIDSLFFRERSHEGLNARKDLQGSIKTLN